MWIPLPAELCLRERVLRRLPAWLQRVLGRLRVLVGRSAKLWELWKRLPFRHELPWRLLSAERPRRRWRALVVHVPRRSVCPLGQCLSKRDSVVGMQSSGTELMISIELATVPRGCDASAEDSRRSSLLTAMKDSI